MGLPRLLHRNTKMGKIFSHGPAPQNIDLNWNKKYLFVFICYFNIIMLKKKKLLE